MPLSSESGWGYNASTGVNVGEYDGKSLIFNSGSSQYLSRSGATATDIDTWTFSFWVKRSTLGGQYLWSVGAVNDRGDIKFNTDDTLQIMPYNSSGANATFSSTMKFRDTSAWYHIVISANGLSSTASTSDMDSKMKVYVNGDEISCTSSVYNTPTGGVKILQNATYQIGQLSASGGNFFDGYMAGVALVDGSVVAPTSFGETSDDTGEWVMKDYSGSHGNLGFYFDFSDTDSTTVTDNSSNSNNFTANNYSSDVDASYTTDTPVDNFSVLNFVDKHSSATLSKGNLVVNGSLSNWYGVTGTTGVSSGKYYWEVDITAIGSYVQLGICNEKHRGVTDTSLETYTSAWGYYSYNGNKLHNSASSSYGATYTTGDTIGVGLDMDAGKVYFYKDGTIQNSGTEAFSSITGHIRPIVQLYGSATVTFDFNPTCPTGYLPLSSANLPEVEIGQQSGDLATDYFSTTLYTGNGSQTRTISGIGFQPDLVWQKIRAGTTQGTGVWDVLRGFAGANALDLAETSVEGTWVGANSAEYGFVSGVGDGTVSLNDGTTATTGGFVNTNTRTYALWCWKGGTAQSSADTTGSGTLKTYTANYNVDAGFQMSAYTGNGTSGHTLPIHLDSAPEMVILKRRTGSADWWGTFHIGTDSSAPEDFYMPLNATDSKQDLLGFMNDTAPTSSVVTLGDNSGVNANDVTYLMYAWHSVEGYSKFGSYKGNGSADGTFVYTGFPVGYVMSKRTDSADNWTVHDVGRDPTGNPSDSYLLLDDTAVEATYSTALVDFLSNGFKWRGAVNYGNNSSGTYVYMAFSRGTGFKYSNAL